MRRLLTVLMVALLPSGASADPPTRDAELDAEHPPLGEPAMTQAARQPARRPASSPARKKPARPKAPPPAAAPAADPAPDGDGAPGPARSGHYGGVDLGADHGPPHPSRGGRGGESQLTWIGFRVDQGVPSVFAELTRPVVWSLDEAAGTLVYTLQQTAIPLANNRRPLDVSQFGTAVQSVVASREGHDVKLVIRFAPAEAGGKPAHRERNQDAPGGLKFLVIELPPPR